MQNNASHLFPNKSWKDAGQTFEINLTKFNKLFFSLYKFWFIILWCGSGGMCGIKPEHSAEHLFWAS